MKKWLAVIGAGALSMGLAACGTETESGMTVEEVFDRTAEASANLESLHADTVMEQTVETGSEEAMTMTMEMAMDATMEPLALYQKGTAVMKAADVPEMPMDVEMYITDEAIYMYEGMMESWLKMPADDLGDLQALIDQQAADPAAQLEDLKEFQDDLTFEETETSYILSLDASGEQFRKLIDEQLSELSGQLGTAEEEALKNMEVHSVTYEIVIDKETYMTTAMDMVMDFTVKAEGDTLRLKQDMQSEFSQFNEIGEITVPQEVVDEAQDMTP